jgi:hypothetical protein
VFVALFFLGCNSKYTIELTAISDTINVGDETYVIPKITPTYENPTYVYDSTNKTVATVDTEGKVTAVSEGSADITVSVEKAGTAKVTITVNGRAYTPTELKTLLVAKYEEYSNSKNGSVKLEAKNATQTIKSELMYNYTEDSIDTFMVTSNAGETAHVYVKDQFAYILRGTEKTKSTLTAAEASLIMTQYGFAKFAEVVASFYNEDAFYQALAFESHIGNVLVFKLNLTAYTGEVFATAGKDSIVLQVTLENDQVAKVETIVTEGTNIETTTLSFLKATPGIDMMFSDSMAIIISKTDSSPSPSNT